MKAASFQPDYFERLYSREADFWKFATSDYERAKYTATVAALGKTRFRKTFEVGCSIGILTGMLAKRCSSLLAVEDYYVLHVLRGNLLYPELKRAIIDQALAFGSAAIIIEDKASGIQLIRISQVNAESRADSVQSGYRQKSPA